MGYRKKYEDSYLDDEEEEFDGTDTTDGERLVRLIKKGTLSDKEREMVPRLVERLFEGVKMPGGPGQVAKEGIIAVVRTYAETGAGERATALATRLMDLATATGNGELYYAATDILGDI